MIKLKKNSKIERPETSIGERCRRKCPEAYAGEHAAANVWPHEE